MAVVAACVMPAGRLENWLYGTGSVPSASNRLTCAGFSTDTLRCGVVLNHAHFSLVSCERKQFSGLLHGFAELRGSFFGNSELVECLSSFRPRFGGQEFGMSAQPGKGRVPLGVVEAAWTRRSKGPLDLPKKNKSFKQRTEKYMKPFMLNVFISSKYVHAKVMHRVTSKVMSVATTNAKDLRMSLPSLLDENACKVVGKLLAERSKEADVYAVQFDLRKGEKFEGKLALVVNTMVENGVALV